MNIEVELRGQTVTVELSVNASEPDVGIMGLYWDDEVIRDEHGKILSWDLSDKEIDTIASVVNDLYYSEREHYYYEND